MPTITKSFIIDADQRFENGRRYEDGVIYSYTTDRKEQNEQTGRRYTVEEFLNDPDIDIQERRRMNDMLGNLTDAIIEEDNPCK